MLASRTPRSARTRCTGAIMGIAGAGLILGHWLAYAIRLPVGADREAVLAQTGHAYLPLLGRVLLLGSLAAAMLIVGRRISRQEEPGPVGGVFLQLAAVQMLAFTAMEIGERAVAGVPLGDLATILPLGLVLQVAFAALGAVLVAVLSRAVGAAVAGASAGWTPPLPRSFPLPLLPDLALPSSPASFAAGIRGPPAR